MNVEITLKNYRCFPDTSPATFTVRTGMTAFVGANNSGKSALLKFFYEFRNLFANLANIGPLRDGITSQITFTPAGIQDQRELFTRSNSRDLNMRFKCLYESDSHEPRSITLNVTVPHGTNIAQLDLTLESGEVVNNQTTVAAVDTSLLAPGQERQEMHEALQMFQALSRTRYIGAFRNAINAGENEDYFDMKTGQSFIRDWRRRQTGSNTAQNEAVYALTEDVRRIFELDDLRINASEDEKTLQLFVNGESRKLGEVGSGLAQFVLVLGSVAFEQPSFILIDEPELNLHPSLQLDFLTTVAGYTTDGVLFSTHSVGLAKSAADWSYALQRRGEGESVLTEYDRAPNLAEFLGELSYSGYRDLTFEKLLFVEGRTDIKAIHQFLRLYGKAHKVVLVPLGGSAMINPSAEWELSEIARITDEVEVLIDSERSARDDDLSKERQGFVDICGKLKVPCNVMERRALENYLSDSAIKNQMGVRFKALEPYEKLEDMDSRWRKSENWRIANKMSLSDIESTDLGRFFDSL